MDYKRIREIKAKSDNLTSRLQLLEEMHKETIEKIAETQNACDHEFVLINKKYANKVYEYLQYGKCLVCGCGITLTSTNVDINNYKIIDEAQIIDVTDGVETFYLDCDCSKLNEELEKAQRVFDVLIGNDDCSKDCLKNSIIYAINKDKLYKKEK